MLKPRGEVVPRQNGLKNDFHTRGSTCLMICYQAFATNLCPFEVIVVEDGSEIPAKEIVGRYQGRLDLHYYVISNSGPGMARNHGARQARGEYLLILDSDVVLHSVGLTYTRLVESLSGGSFGGPDKAHASFSPIQKAINYAMTSFLTTGGIRGGKKKVG